MNTLTRSWQLFQDRILPLLQQFADRMIANLEQWDAERQANQPRPDCDRNIICNDGAGCGRRSCPARTLNVSYYTRKIKEA